MLLAWAAACLVASAAVEASAAVLSLGCVGAGCAEATHVTEFFGGGMRVPGLGNPLDIVGDIVGDSEPTIF